MKISYSLFFSFLINNYFHLYLFRIPSVYRYRSQGRIYKDLLSI
jgi:hypothetical protein